MGLAALASSLEAEGIETPEDMLDLAPAEIERLPVRLVEKLQLTKAEFEANKCPTAKWDLAVPAPKANVKNHVAYQQGFKEGREEGKEKGEEEGEIKGIKVTQDLFDCCEAAAGKIPGDPQKNIGTCMDDPEFAKKYGCAPKDDDPKTEERLRTAMADEAKTKRK